MKDILNYNKKDIESVKLRNNALIKGCSVVEDSDKVIITSNDMVLIFDKQMRSLHNESFDVVEIYFNNRQPVLYVNEKSSIVIEKYIIFEDIDKNKERLKRISRIGNLQVGDMIMYRDGSQGVIKDIEDYKKNNKYERIIIIEGINICIKEIDGFYPSFYSLSSFPQLDIVEIISASGIVLYQRYDERDKWINGNLIDIKSYRIKK